MDPTNNGVKVLLTAKVSKDGHKILTSIFIKINFFAVVDCGFLSVPEDSLGGLTVTFTDTVFNITATYSCPSLGFVLIGTAERICEVDGNWSSVTPHCESMQH